jgi:hypothetical protein
MYFVAIAAFWINIIHRVLSSFWQIFSFSSNYQISKTVNNLP